MNKTLSNTNKLIKLSKRTFLALQIFNGLSALAGGFGLMGDPSGQSLQMDTSMLANSPFNSFLIPGIVLFVVNGLGNVMGTILTLTRYKFAGQVAVLFGIVLMGWIVVQVVWVGYASLLQPLYFATGLAQTLAGYLYIRQLDKL
jgi:hypothetical protein